MLTHSPGSLDFHLADTSSNTAYACYSGTHPIIPFCRGRNWTLKLAKELRLEPRDTSVYSLAINCYTGKMFAEATGKEVGCRECLGSRTDNTKVRRKWSM